MSVARWSWWGLAGLLVGSLAVGAGMVVAQDAGGEVFYACQKDGKVEAGTIRVGEAPTCKRGATVISWNQEGPAGQDGDKGDPGAAGQGSATAWFAEPDADTIEVGYSDSDGVSIHVQCDVSGSSAVVGVAAPTGTKVRWMYANNGSLFPEFVATGAYQQLAPPQVSGPIDVLLVAPDGAWSKRISGTRVHYLDNCNWGGMVTSS